MKTYNDLVTNILNNINISRADLRNYMFSKIGENWAKKLTKLEHELKFTVQTVNVLRYQIANQIKRLEKYVFTLLEVEGVLPAYV